jgi:conjugal transfer pilus assembly protein TraU
MIRLYLILLLIFSKLSANEGHLINPLTDICWDCLFPITVSGINVTPGNKDFSSHQQPICICSGTPPKIGVPLTLWEPTRIVDVTRHAYKLMGLGGISIGSENIKNRGSVGMQDETSTQHSFYHVHWYEYPILSLLEILTDFSCLEKGQIDMCYMSEFDILWNNDRAAVILDPEAALFGNPLAQAACIADCAESNFNVPDDKLFWCAGCQGSLYPFTGSVAHHVGGLQASSLLVQRTIAKLHRSSVLKGFNKEDFCEPRVLPIIKKSLYKTQLVFPVPQTKGQCHALGKSDQLWGVGKSFPYGGEDFVYLLWIKKQCCLDAVKPAATAGGI